MINQALEITDHQTSVVPADVSAGALQSALAGDLKRLTTEDRLKYYGALCNLTGLNPLSKPFDWLELQGRLVLYANKGCAEQLRKLHKVSIDIVERKVEHGCLIIRVKAVDEDGRHDEAIGAVPFNEKNSVEAANAMMKCETKAKRRVTLSICGLGILDESELDTVRGSKIAAEVTGQETAEERADRLNASLTGGEKEKSINIEVLPTERVVATQSEAPQVASQPIESDAAVSATAASTASPSAEEKMAEELQRIFSKGSNPPSCLAYCIHREQIKKGEDLARMNPDYAKRIIANPKQFLLSVENWEKGHRLAQPSNLHGENP